MSKAPVADLDTLERSLEARLRKKLVDPFFDDDEILGLVARVIIRAAWALGWADADDVAREDPECSICGQQLFCPKCDVSPPEKPGEPEPEVKP